MKVVITGGTGLIGNYLQKQLLLKKYEVVVLSRTKKKSSTKGLSYAQWDIENEIIDVDLVCSADYIIHLAGANIADKRWSEKQKEVIVNSRLKTTHLLFKTLKENPHQVKSIISASGADCYGVKTTNKLFKESDEFGDDFLSKVCKVWEAAVLQFNEIGVNTVCLRTGVVFAKENSALQKMTRPIKIGVGSPLGSGKQIMSYIHIHDLCNLYIYMLENNMSGFYNAVAANSSNNEVTQAIAKELKKPLFMPNVPNFVLKLIFGEMASILLEGSAVDNDKIKATDFRFTYPDLESILKDVL